MNKIYSRLIVVTIALLSFGCAPLQQAPLLYSSKTSVGIDVSATTTETPGAAISLGVKVVDAAYVPVAVSKDPSAECDTGDEGCIKSLNRFDILKIEAIYGEGTTGSKLDSLTSDNREKITNYLEAKKEEDSARNEFKEIEETIKGFEEKRKTILSQQQSTNNVDTQIESKNKIKEEKKRIWDIKKAEAEKLFTDAAQAASLLRTDKRDAMSVYGRFDSKGGGNTASSSPSANLAVGKIFSTGVASQNLTEAVMNSARYTALASCIEQIKSLVVSIPTNQPNKQK
uniref:Lipoprotein n=1 Tax=Candidatus Kentrum sp. UNK TaxID=2126344 RepID=A0A451ALK5_9GAMM|nr:MAG: hypothetical protein BECKUNK1418G_GA0071005_11166 [Candidatus Kentron sp. UNK]